MEKLRQVAFDQAEKAVEALEYLVGRLGIFVAGTPEEIRRQLDVHRTQEPYVSVGRESAAPPAAQETRP